MKAFSIMIRSCLMDCSVSLSPSNVLKLFGLEVSRLQKPSDAMLAQVYFVEIDSTRDNRISKFVGDEASKTHIAEEVRSIFSRKIG